MVADLGGGKCIRLSHATWCPLPEPPVISPRSAACEALELN